ncbi:hypothetical protein L218DRAFT_949001 [Marasmius fiardii PR-910]|nr:hypothetical protein L218DRAFT_949001 [Marasmius fiardii PR-910]
MSDIMNIIYSSVVNNSSISWSPVAPKSTACLFGKCTSNPDPISPKSTGKAGTFHQSEFEPSLVAITAYTTGDKSRNMILFYDMPMKDKNNTKLCYLSEVYHRTEPTTTSDKLSTSMHHSTPVTVTTPKPIQMNLNEKLEE